MEFGAERTYSEVLIKFAYATEMWALLFQLRKIPVPSLKRLVSATSRAAERLEAEGPGCLENILKEEISRAFPKAPAKRKVDSLRLAEIGRDGGFSRSRRKKRSSRKNGLKGGRPSPDFTTRTQGEGIYQALLAQDPKAWFSVANYRLSPRILKYVESLLHEHGTPKARVGLPEVWSPSAVSADPIKRNADAARRHAHRYGHYVWPKWGPRPRRYLNAIFSR